MKDLGYSRLYLSSKKLWLTVIIPLNVYNLANKTNNKQPSYMTNQFGLFEQLLL